MIVHAVPPADRFDGTEVSNEIDDARALSMYLEYRCPRCAQGVWLAKADLENRTRITHLFEVGE